MTKAMSPLLKRMMQLTDGAFLLYWAIHLMHLVQIIRLPETWMYEHFDEPLVVAWNWSFLPIDVAFSIIGFASISAYARHSNSWRPLCIISLTLTMAAGLMAVSYWMIRGEYNPLWFIPNLMLVIWPMFFLPTLIRESAANE